MSLALRTTLARHGSRSVVASLLRHGPVAAATFSSPAHYKKDRDEELLWKNYQDAFDESDWIETGKQKKEVVKEQETFSSNDSSILQSLKSAEEQEEKAMKQARRMGKQAVHKMEETLQTMKEKARMVFSSSDDSSSDHIISKDELYQKTFGDAFDESDAIEKGKEELERIAIIAERVESMKY